MNTGNSAHDPQVIGLANAWSGKPEGSGWVDPQLPYYYADPDTLPRSRDFYADDAVILTLGQVFGTIQRLSQRVEELELDLKIATAQLDCVVAQQAHLNTAIGDEHHTATREHWNLIAGHVRFLEAKRDRLKKR